MPLRLTANYRRCGRNGLVLVALALLPLRAAPALESGWQAEILLQVNAARAAQALAPLQWNARLAVAAAAHAADLQTCAKLAHDGCDGSDLPLRIARAGYRPRRAAENLALCPCDAAEVVRLWLNSAGHRHNLLDPDVTEMGADTRADVVDLRRAQWVLVTGRAME